MQKRFAAFCQGTGCTERRHQSFHNTFYIKKIIVSKFISPVKLSFFAGHGKANGRPFIGMFLAIQEKDLAFLKEPQVFCTSVKIVSDCFSVSPV
jgi:hypothetical protein